ncbi:tubulin polymerization-promoting protein family member 2-like [Acanthaster planci]|uniref:Tubulin polymerization-promoting protein family member 2-like n=1 Tax=Acanthaster planci TaxID=133434 RepID=A0A8B7XNB1_ACAPL|nr:tubulin polymerization-promoting protein family member 2-like [Acanthaster planci]XP_022082309.1 tubulin polymerization-promoting protein family member 2-like [Acanthaster planci]XP_022082310.1 tubulin polymerization-promoting protein family member 2-like [Acanthaster planci]XP_022082311.1 tubulin polymerization-promoting protein family member 2-like [Acanthaster planci]
MADATLKRVFEEYAAFGRPGQTKDITSKNFTKLFKEKGLIDSKKLDGTEVDIIFARAKGGPGNKVLTFELFKKALVMAGKSKYGTESDENTEKIKSKVIAGGGPSTPNTTGTSRVGAVDRLTDTSKYTGSHKERFDERGKGRGLEGRKDLKRDTGYVTNYKGEGTYDTTH